LIEVKKNNPFWENPPFSKRERKITLLERMTLDLKTMKVKVHY